MVRLIVCICVLLAAGFAEEFDGNDAETKTDDPTIDSQIVGGRNADIRNYPYQIQLLMNGGLRCGGTILSRSYILTAAHCTNGISASTLSIRAGSSFLNGGTVIKVSGVSQHPQYNSKTIDYDASVLKLASSLNYGTEIRSIGLASNLPADGTMMTVTGWGLLRQNGSGPKQMQVVELPKVNFNQCVKQGYVLTARMVCAGPLQGGKGTCNGDSGGPLTAQGKVSGIVSFGIGCASRGFPSVFASVPSMYSWIVSKVVFD